MSWTLITHWQVALGAIGAALTLAAFVWRHGLRRLWVYFQGSFHAVSSRQALHFKIDAILKELHPNGGDSIRDLLDRLEGKLERADARVLSVLEDSGVPMWEADAAGRRSWANAAFLALVDRPLDEVVGYGWINAIHWDDRERVRGRWFEAVAERRNFEEVYRLVTPLGRVTRVSVIARPFSAGGRLVSYIAHLTIRDP